MLTYHKSFIPYRIDYQARVLGLRGLANDGYYQINVASCVASYVFIIGVGAVPADHFLVGKKENLLQIVHAYIDNKFYNRPTSLCRFQCHANSFDSYFLNSLNNF